MEINYDINIGQIISDDFVRFHEGDFPYSDLKRHIYTVIHNLSFERKLGERIEDVLKRRGIETKESENVTPFSKEWYTLNKNILWDLEKNSYLPLVASGNIVFSMLPNIKLVPQDRYYSLFFSIKLNMLVLDDIDNFLDHILKNDFENDFKKFKRFLELRFRGDTDILSIEAIDTAKEWIENFIELKTDNRIKGNLSKSEIEMYFKNTFSEKQKDQNPILTEEQINQFLHSNFTDFNPPKEIIKFHTANTTQQKIRKIIHDFYLKHSPNTKTEAYINLLKSNFSKFENTSFSSEQSNFHK